VDGVSEDAPEGVVRGGTSRKGVGSDHETRVSVLRGDEVLEMTMEEYLVGAVAGEMPASFEREALRAQAVAARTLVLYRRLVAPNTRHPDADVCTDPSCCMAYDESVASDVNTDTDGNLAEIKARIADAVRSTDGVYADYGGEPILAAFHSSSGGKTEDSGSVWGGQLPYLVSVGSLETPEQNPRYYAQVYIPADEFRRTVLEGYPEARFEGDISQWITDVSYTRGGRIASLTVGGVELPGTHVRAMFALASTDADFYVTGDGVTFVTRGHGHGVGMSQYGANAMAASGASYTDILRAYYTGITLTDLNA
jgi:stage II sporulation protein D